jgi:hypothetical protein
MEKLEWMKADAATIKTFKASQKTELETAREFAEAEANYRTNLECADIALQKFKRLTAEDREDIEIAVMHLKIGWALHEQSSDPVSIAAGRKLSDVRGTCHRVKMYRLRQ